jgi:hypothetical protein
MHGDELLLFSCSPEKRNVSKKVTGRMQKSKLTGKEKYFGVQQAEF